MLDDTDVLVEDLLPWRRSDLTENKPRPLVIEVFLDTSHLSHNQALVVVDEAGKRWDVADALGSSSESSPRPTRNGGRFCEVVLERWIIELGDANDDHSASELNDALPNVYKKGVVLFRSLFCFTRFLPAWNLHRKLTRQPGSHQALRLKFRIKQGHSSRSSRKDSLYAPLCPSERAIGSMVERYPIPPLVCRSGLLSISVDYRTSCEFTVADSEALLSSRFMGFDESPQMMPVGRSLPGARSEQARIRYSSLAGPAGEQKARVGAYGSLGTFHAGDKRGSPITDLKQQRVRDEYDDNYQDTDRVYTLSHREKQDLQRRPSTSLVNNPPFKGGSLASTSPRPSPSPGSGSRAAGEFMRLGTSTGSKRISLNTLPQQSLRAPPLPNETAIASSGSSSPKPTPLQRYSSSFAGRTKRFVSPGSRTAESNISSGRNSSSLKEKPTSQFTSGTPGSSGSGQTDEDDIAAFISQVESAKDLRSLHSRPASRGNTVNLAKYSMMRDPGLQLAEEMSSSSLIQSSVTPPSRRLSNVPGLSVSSSPSRALAHQPHVRSRLSTHSIAEETSGASGVSGTSGASGEGLDSPKIQEEDEDEDDMPFIFASDQV